VSPSARVVRRHRGRPTVARQPRATGRRCPMSAYPSRRRPGSRAPARASRRDTERSGVPLTLAAFDGQLTVGRRHTKALAHLQRHAGSPDHGTVVLPTTEQRLTNNGTVALADRNMHSHSHTRRIAAARRQFTRSPGGLCGSHSHTRRIAAARRQFTRSPGEPSWVRGRSNGSRARTGLHGGGVSQCRVKEIHCHRGRRQMAWLARRRSALIVDLSRRFAHATRGAIWTRLRPSPRSTGP